MTVTARDWPYWVDWKPVPGLLPEADEARLKALGAPDPHPDAVIRVAAPYDFGTTPGVPTLVMVTSETGRIQPEKIAGGLPIDAAVAASDALIHTPSRWSRDGLVASGVPGERIAVIGHGVDTALWRPADAEARHSLRGRFGWEDDFVLLNVGAMTGNKGIDLLLAGFAALLETCPRARLVLKGLDAIFRSRDMVADLLNHLPEDRRAAVASRLTYIGHSVSLADLAKLFQAADAYVSPYRGEGFNLPVLEAAACGLPVICTAGGATDDFTASDFALRVDAALDGEQHVLEPSGEHLLVQLRRCVADDAWRLAAQAAGPAFVAPRPYMEACGGKVAANGRSGGHKRRPGSRLIRPAPEARKGPLSGDCCCGVISHKVPGRTGAPRPGSAQEPERTDGRVLEDPDREPGRDRLPDHAHGAPDGHKDGRRLLRGGRPGAACRDGGRGDRDRPRAGGAKLSGRRPDHRGGEAKRRGGRASGLRLPVRECRLRRAAGGRRHHLHWTQAEGDRGNGRQDRIQAPRPEGWRQHRAGPSRRGAGRGRRGPHRRQGRLSGHDQGVGRRRRQGHAHRA